MLLSLLLACAAPPRDAPAERRPDVLLVVLDTVRADALDAYGYGRETAPNLSRLAERGVLFEDVTTSGTWSWPSHASLFTGEPPWVHGAHFAGGGEGSTSPTGEYRITELRPDLPTLAQRFTEAGYRTVCVGANPWLRRGLGLDRGFETLRFEHIERVVDAAREVVEDREEDGRPLLLVVNLFDAHAPYVVHDVFGLRQRPELSPAGAPAWLRPYLSADRGELAVNLFMGSDAVPNGVFAYARGLLEIPPEGLALLRDVYDGEVAEADRKLGRLLGIWRGVSEERVVAVTSDHGEFLGERQRMDHGRSVYPEVSWVPLVIAGRGRLPAGRRVDSPVQLRALYDTLLELAGLAHGADSLLPVIGGAPGPASIQAMAWADDLWPKYVGPPHHLGERLYRVGEEAVVLRGEDRRYFRLSEDPGMERDRSASYPARAAALSEAAAGAFPEGLRTDTLAMDPELDRPLRAMGYIE